MPDDSVLLIDPWTLRCFWGQSNYFRRYELQEFDVEVRLLKRSSKRPGERHCLVIASKDGQDVFQAHHFVGIENGKRTTPVDPKQVLFKGLLWRKDDKQENPYEGRRIRGWVYARWRKLTCPLLRYRWFWAVTVACFPRTKDSLQSIREAVHRVVWIIGAHIFCRV